MASEMTILDPVSEMLALSSCGNNKSLLFAGVETQGPLDEQASRLAVKRATTRFPHFGDTLRETRRNCRFRLVVEGTSNPVVPVFFSDVPRETAALPGPENIVDHLAIRLDRNWDLFREPPAEVHFLRLSPDRHIIVPIIHHMAGDAVTLAKFGKEFLLRYHEIVRGRHYRMSDDVHTGYSDQVMRPRRSGSRRLRDSILRLRENRLHMSHWVTRPLGSGMPNDLRQFHVKRLFTEEETRRIREIHLQERASLADHLTASANLAIDRWNQRLGISPGIIVTGVSYDLRKRSHGFQGPNAGSLTFFKSFPSERSNQNEFTRALAIQKIKQMRIQSDFAYVNQVAALSRILSVLPFRVRRRIVDTVNKRRLYSLFIVTLDEMWPGLAGGRATAESDSAGTGDLTIREVHAVGYKLCTNATPLFIAYVFNKCLNLVFAAGASLFTRSETEAFMDLTVEHLFR